MSNNGGNKKNLPPVRPNALNGANQEPTKAPQGRDPVLDLFDTLQAAKESENKSKPTGENDEIELNGGPHYLTPLNVTIAILVLFIAGIIGTFQLISQDPAPETTGQASNIPTESSSKESPPPPQPSGETTTRFRANPSTTTRPSTPPATSPTEARNRMLRRTQDAPASRDRDRVDDEYADDRRSDAYLDRREDLEDQPNRERRRKSNEEGQSFFPDEPPADGYDDWEQPLDGQDGKRKESDEILEPPLEDSYEEESYENQ